ncbi:MAG: hypothetical protein Q8N43_02990 [Candidatus Azambacteria bacterium]|nr:hypothetical protein [Candidatus Azambacteria bacterium]
MSKLFNKKFLAVVFIALIIVSIAPKPVSASVPIFEMNPIVTGDVVNFGEMLFEWAFKIAAEALKRQLLNMIVDQIVAWIQGGGEPKFITDWPGFFRDAVDQAGGKFIQRIGLSQLCSPFKLLLGAAFIPIPTFTERTSCTLSRIGVNIDAFLENFENGGWIAWQEMVLKPQNNVYGAYLLAWDQYEIEKSAAVKAAASEAQAGRGFLGVKRCIASHQENTGDAAGEIEVCDKYETVTPGAVVGDLASKAVGSDIDYIVNAQDFAAYVGAIVNAILNRIFAEGVGLLHAGLSGDAGGGGGGGGGGGSAQAQCAQLVDTPAYNDCIAAIQAGADILEFRKNHLISLIDQVLDSPYQNRLLAAKQATLTILNKSVDILIQLQNCQESVPPALAQVQGAASTMANQITLIQSDIIALEALQQKIREVTDPSQIPALYTQVTGIINSIATLNSALDAEKETIQKQTDMNLYQQQLFSCLSSKI